jgi:hypothetical protein
MPTPNTLAELLAVRRGNPTLVAEGFSLQKEEEERRSHYNKINDPQRS